MPALCLLLSCSASNTPSVPLAGTWRLLSGTTITRGDSTVTDYTKGVRMIKIINGSHFAFLRHDTDAPRDSSNHFDAGGGRYTLDGHTYTEHLDYYADRNWEGKTFVFTISIHNDTLYSGVLKRWKAQASTGRSLSATCG